MYLQNIESAELFKYNANSRGNNVGDCVKRALTIAYSMDYDEVSKELNRIKRVIGEDQFNNFRVLDKFIRNKGDRLEPVGKDLVNPKTGEVLLSTDSGVTAGDVCDYLPEGTYVLHVKNPTKKSRVTHLCAVVNGVLYDSWDSRSWKVDWICAVKDSVKELHEFDYARIFQKDLPDVIIPYCQKLQSKQDPNGDLLSSIQLSSYITITDHYTCRYTVVIEFLQKPPRSSKYSRVRSWGHSLVAKLNPTMDEDQNVKSLQKKLCQKIYDWVYNVLKDVRDSMAVESYDWESGHAGYLTREEQKMVMNLPDWVKERVSYFAYIPDMHEYNDYQYELEIDALEDDPNIDERGDTVRFIADSWTELKKDLQHYQESFARYGYDY